MGKTPTFSISSLKSETSLSDLIHRIGHDIGNPLTSLISLSSLIERSDGDFKLSEEDLKRYARTIISDAWKIQGISEKLTLLLSDRGREAEPVDIREAASSAIRKTLRRNRFSEGDVIVSYGEEPLIALIDSAQAEWLIGELLSNALCASSKCSPENYTAELYAAKTGDEIRITVSNYSHPVEVELHTLFEPFVKLHSEGCGLGLTAAWAVVSRAGGRIEIDYSDEQFTTTVYLRAV
jgi:signal transduction histidine kinase